VGEWGGLGFGTSEENKMILKVSKIEGVEAVRTCSSWSETKYMDDERDELVVKSRFQAM
jgi:hypothetical protein